VKNVGIVTAGTLIILAVGAGLVSCSRGALTPSASASTTSSSGNKPAISGGVIHSGLPVNIDYPSDGATIRGNTVTVRGKTAPNASVSIESNIVTAEGSGAFSALVNLDEGPNAIDIVSTDASNNQGEVMLMVNSVQETSSSASSGDALPLKVTEPADAANIATSAVIVKGQTSPGATVTVNGVPDTADSNGNFSIQVSLEPGLNAIDVVAIDENGHQAEVLLIVNDTAAQ
jgi:hypothetical protein